MPRSSIQMTVSLPPDLYRSAMRVAKEEFRSKSELVREALRSYVSRRERDEDRRVMKIIEEAQAEKAKKPMTVEEMLAESDRLARYGAERAKRLGIKWDSSTRIGKTHGIYGGAIPMYLHDIEMEIINYPNSRVQTTVAFVDLPNVDVLLGQIGFFEHYHVKFRHSAREIDIEIPAQTP